MNDLGSIAQFLMYFNSAIGIAIVTGVIMLERRLTRLETEMRFVLRILKHKNLHIDDSY